MGVGINQQPPPDVTMKLFPAPMNRDLAAKVAASRHPDDPRAWLACYNWLVFGCSEPVWREEYRKHTGE